MKLLNVERGRKPSPNISHYQLAAGRLIEKVGNDRDFVPA
jgi:hypothetical protein